MLLERCKRLLDRSKKQPPAKASWATQVVATPGSDLTQAEGRSLPRSTQRPSGPLSLRWHQPPTSITIAVPGPIAPANQAVGPTTAELQPRGSYGSSLTGTSAPPIAAVTEASSSVGLHAPTASLLADHRVNITNPKLQLLGQEHTTIHASKTDDVITNWRQRLVSMLQKVLKLLACPCRRLTSIGFSTICTLDNNRWTCGSLLRQACLMFVCLLWTNPPAADHTWEWFYTFLFISSKAVHMACRFLS